MASGEVIAAIAMTEPGGGSDLANMSTRARREGDEYVRTGAKTTFITKGGSADLVLVAAKTDPEAGPMGVSLLLVDARDSATAPEPAGVIHTDFQRGFIEAEIVSFDELMSAESMQKAKEAGKVRMEGKEYVMADGDVVESRFNGDPDRLRRLDESVTNHPPTQSGRGHDLVARVEEHLE